jgi:SAM-dependent methyltransferase
MSATLEFDEETARRVEAVYMTPDVVAQRDEVRAALALKPGEAVLDIGSGPGLLAQELAEAVGAGGRVRGVDRSADILAMASRRCADLPWVEFAAADATTLPYPDASFDAAVSTQVYEYVADIPAALAELHRILRPGGRAAILDTDYGSLVLHSDDTARMARVLAAWDEHFLHPGLPRILSPHLRAAGFALRQRGAIPLFNTDCGPDTFSHGMIGIVAAFVAGRNGVSKDEAEAWAAELRELGRQGRYFFSLNRYLFVADKPEA